MEKVDLLNIEGIDGKLLQFAIIDRGNGEFTSMLKSTYDEQQAQAEHFTPILPA
jgi:hypothetical protein